MQITDQLSSKNLVARLLDQHLAKGRAVISLAELEQESDLTPIAIKRQIEHLGERVKRLPGRPTIYLQVTPEHRVRGSPPVAAWLGSYLQLRGIPYYLGLLSAASLHGASQQAVQTTQIIVPNPTRPIDLGRVHIDFFVKSSIALTPLTEIRGLPAHLAVSTPEATALDLIMFSSRIGGITRVAQVIRDMQPSMTVRGLTQALNAEQQTSIKQRLGYLFEVLGLSLFAATVQKALPSRLDPAILQVHAECTSNSIKLPWYILDNTELQQNIE
jgi:hypothetical protein